MPIKNPLLYAKTNDIIILNISGNRKDCRYSRENSNELGDRGPDTDRGTGGGGVITV